MLHCELLYIPVHGDWSKFNMSPSWLSKIQHLSYDGRLEVKRKDNQNCFVLLNELVVWLMRGCSLTTQVYMTSIMLLLCSKTMSDVCARSPRCPPPSLGRGTVPGRLSCAGPRLHIVADRQHVVRPVHGDRPELVLHDCRQFTGLQTERQLVAARLCQLGCRRLYQRDSTGDPFQCCQILAVDRTEHRRSVSAAYMLSHKFQMLD